MINSICDYCASDELGDIIESAKDIIDYTLITDNNDRINISIGNNADSIGLIIYKETPYKLMNGKTTYASDPVERMTLPFNFCPMCGRRLNFD